VVVSQLIRDGIDLSTLPTDGIRIRDLLDPDDAAGVIAGAVDDVAAATP
jgi:hypothetical protein